MTPERSIKPTKDGWNTLYVPELNETYHSIHGARQEAEHVFLKCALDYSTCSHPKIFEVGFGTGLNALLTCMKSINEKKHILYYSIEKYPLTIDEARSLGFDKLLSKNEYDLFVQLHSVDWNEEIIINEFFTLKKFQADLLHFKTIPQEIDIVYFDAFAPNKQEKLWSTDVFKAIHSNMNKKAVLTTYCAKGQVRRNMIEAGFEVSRIQGPPGKREMLRAQIVD